MNKRIILLGLLIAAIGFIAGKYSSKSDIVSTKVQDSLRYSELPESISDISCSTALTVSVSGQNNPQKHGLYGTVWNTEEKTSFIIHKNESQLTLDGFSLFDKENNWQIISDEDILIAQLLLPPKTAPDSQNFFTMFLDKNTGQGMLNRSGIDTYVNRQTSGYVTYFSCSD